MTLINIPGPLPIIKVQALPLPNDGALLTVIHATSVPYAAVYRVDMNDIATFIGRDEPNGKADSASSIVREDGSVEMYVSEADPNASGTTCKIHKYVFPNAVAPNYPNSAVDEFARGEIVQIKQGLTAAGS